MTQESDRKDQEQDEGVFKKPLSGSFKRVANQFEEDMETKTPTQAIEDDISGPATKPEEEENLERKVQQQRDEKAE